MRRARRPGLRALMEASKCEPTPAGRGRSGVPPGAADQRGGAPLPGRCRGRAAADRGRGAGGADRGRAGPGELGAAGDRAGGRRGRRGGAAGAARGAARGARAGRWPARAGTRAWSGSSPRGWSSATTGRSSSISLDGEGGGRGSGRSIPGFDLLAALRGLLRAPGELRRAPRRGRARRCGPRTSRPSARRSRPTPTAVLGPEDLRRTERIDAMVGGVGLGLDLAEELGQLAPFGMGNPGVRLMVPSARVSDVRTMGGGQARALQPAQRRPPGARRRLRPLQPRGRGRGAGRRRGAARGQPLERLGRAARRPARALPAGGRAAGDGGAVAARLRVRRRGVVAALRGRAAAATSPSRRVAFASEGPESAAARPGAWSAARGSATAAIAELVSSGAGVLAVCADASRRAALAGGATGLARFNGGAAPHRLRAAAARGASTALGRASRRRARADRLRGAGRAAPELAAALRARGPRRPAASARPSAARGRSRPDRRRGPRLPAPGSGPRPSASSRSPSLDEQARLAAGDRRRLPRACARPARRAGRELREALAGGGAHPLAAGGRGPLLPGPRASWISLRASPDGGAGAVGVVSSEGTDLERSAAFRAYSSRSLGGSAIPRKTQTAVEHSRAPRRPLRRGRGVRLRAERRRQRQRRRHRGGGGDDRPRRGRARLRLRLRAPRRPAALLGRRVHHPPGRGRAGLRRACGSTPRRSARRCSTTRSRTPAPAWRRSATEFGEEIAAAGRRRHQADRDDLREPRRAPGRELPQDDGGDGHRRQGDPDQAGRPPPQHAHARRAAEAEADGEVARDAGDLRAARPPARDPRDQVGARGPRLRDPAPAQVRRNQAAGRPAARRARELRHRRRRASSPRSWSRSGSRPRSPAAPSTSTRSTRRWRRRAASSTRSSTSPRCG